MSKIRNKLIATLTIFAMLFTSLSAVMFAGNNFAQAEETEPEVQAVFQIKDGATSGYLGLDEDGKDYAGLRWETKINKQYYNSLSGEGITLDFGTLIAPKDYVADLDFSKLSYDQVNDEWYVTGTEKYVSNIPDFKVKSKMESIGNDLAGEYVMYSAIRYEDFEEVGLNEKAYSTELVAKAYVKITNGENVSYEYSEADTIRSLRNSIAYNLVAGNFSEEDATSLKKFAVEGDIIDASNEQYAFFNKSNSVTFSQLVGASDVELIINSKPADFSIDENGVVAFDAVNTNLEYVYVSAFANGNLYYKKLTVAQAISTAEEFVETFGLAKGDLTVAYSLDEVATFDGVFVLTNNIDFAGKAMPNEYFYNLGLTLNKPDFNDSNPNGQLMKTKALCTGSVFDGQGYAIKNITASYSGIFGAISGTVKNVAFINAKVNGEYSGFLAQRIYLSALIQNVYLDVTARSYALAHAMVTGTNLDTVYVKSNAPLLEAESSYGTDGNMTITANMFRNSKLIYVSNRLIAAQGTHRVGYLSNEYTLPTYINGTILNLPDLGFEEVTENVFTPGPGGKAKITAEGKVHRFEDEELLIEKYSSNETAKEFIDSFDNEYFNVNNDGRISWANDYYLYDDNGAVANNTVALSATGTLSQDGFAVKDRFGNVVEGFIYKLANNDGVLSIENATITALKAGTATLEVYKDGVIYFTVTVNVEKSIVELTENIIIVDNDGEIFDAVKEEIISITVRAEGVEAKFVDGVLTLDGAVANTKYVIEFETEKTIYLVSVKYVTNYIRTAEEFVSIFALAKGELTSATTLEDLAVFDGYYLLANNIDFAGKAMPTDTYTFSFANHYNTASAYATAKTKGLTGTFDGNGYTIYNLKAPKGGIFGIISGDIKNVAFINLDLAQGATGGMLAALIAEKPGGASSLTNVYIDYSAGYSANKYVLANISRYQEGGVVFNNTYISAEIPLFKNVVYAPEGKTGETQFTNPTYTSASFIYISKHSPVLGDGTYRIYDLKGTFTTDNKPWRENARATVGEGGYKDFGSASALRFNSVNAESDAYSLVSGYANATYKAIIDTYNNEYFDVGVDGRIGWRKDTKSYAVYQDSNLAYNDTVVLRSSGDGSETVLSVRNSVGNAVDGFKYELLDNEGVVALDGAKLTALKIGTATVLVKDRDDIVWFTVSVDVTKLVIDRTSETIIVDSFGEEVDVLDTDILSGRVDGASVLVDENVVAVKFETEPSKTEASNFVIELETETNVVLFTAEYYTSYIKTPEEFVETFSFGSDSTVVETISAVTGLPNFNGYYRLVNNIDFTDKIMPTDKYTYGSVSTITSYGNNGVKDNYGLTGTFDGDGYMINNLIVPQGGIFGVISGSVKNVAFNNITFADTTANGLMARYIYGSATLSNVYIKYGGSYSGNYSMLGMSVGTGISLNNCYFEGPIMMARAISSNDAKTYNPSGASFANTNNTVIVVSEYIFGARGGSINQGSGVWMDGNKTGNTPVEAKNPGRSGSNTGGVASYRAKGAMYRYSSVEEMLSIYTDAKTVKKWTYIKEDGTNGTALRTLDPAVELTGLTTQQNALGQLLGSETQVGKWDYTYFNFDKTHGLTWKTDYSGYKLYADNEELVDDINLDTETLNVQKGLSIKNSFGEVLENSAFDFVLSNDVVTIEGATITANKVGTCTLYIKHRNNVVFTVNISVTKPIVELEGQVILEKGKPLAIDLQDIDSQNIVAAYSNTEGFAVDFIDGKAVVTDCVYNQEFELSVEDKTNVYTISAICYSAYIETAEEFIEVFGLKKDIDSSLDFPVYDGYYVLANNIDLEGYSFEYGLKETARVSDTSKVGLTGTFDGQGYTVSNLVAAEGGLFGAINGTVKNVAFINADVKVKVYQREASYVEPGSKNYTENGQNDPQYVVTEREHARDKDGQLQYSSTITSSGILCRYLNNCLLENVYLTWGNTTPIEFAEGADPSNYNAYLNKTAIGQYADVRAKLFNVYCEGELKFAGITDNYVDSSRNHLFFQDTLNKVVFVSNYVVARRASSSRYGHTGVPEGSTTETALGIVNVVASQNYGFVVDPLHLRGDFYRYASVEEMSSIYQATEDSRTAYLKQLLATYDSTYFTVDETTGVITWNTNVTE